MIARGLFVQAAGSITITTGQRASGSHREGAELFGREVLIGAFRAWIGSALRPHPIVRRLLGSACFFEGATHGI